MLPGLSIQPGMGNSLYTVLSNILPSLNTQQWVGIFFLYSNIEYPAKDEYEGCSINTRKSAVIFLIIGWFQLTLYRTLQDLTCRNSKLMKLFAVSDISLTVHIYCYCESESYDSNIFTNVMVAYVFLICLKYKNIEFPD